MPEQPRTTSGTTWRTERAKGMLGIAAATIPSAALWYWIRFNAPILEGMDEPAARLMFALKCAALAVLFTLVLGIEAVAHERLVSPAFDPLAGHETRRMRVNQRYLQNTLEQTVVFFVGLLGLAVYMADGNEMRAVLASAVVWTLGRLAFWGGYHVSSTWRCLGAPSMLLGQLVLGYVGLRVGFDVAGEAGAGAVLVAFLLFETLLFWWTRPAKGKTPMSDALTLGPAVPILFVRDVSAAAEFYGSKLGFATEFLHGDPPFYGEVRRGSAVLHLRHVARPNFAELASREVSLILATIAVPDVRALYAELEGRGAPFVQYLVQQPWGGLDCQVEDPDGNRISFVTYQHPG